MRHLLASLCIAGLVLFSAGCGGGGPAKYKVTGKVTFADGTPLTKGIVIFANPAGNARGQLDSSGNYKLGMEGAGDGAGAGTYQVFLAGPIFDAPQPSTGTDDYMAIKEETEALVNPKFREPTTSGLTCEVKGSTTFDITVEKP
jgi:hypothetical protein